MIKLSYDLEKPCQNDIAHGVPQKHKIAGLGRIPKPMWPGSQHHTFMGLGEHVWVEKSLYLPCPRHML